MRIRQRLEKMEKTVVQSWAFVTRVVCKGSEPTEEEQSRINDAKSKGGLVIVRRVLAPHERQTYEEKS